MRQLVISFVVAENRAGSVLADLADRVQSLNFKVVEELEDPHKNRPQRDPRGSVWNAFEIVYSKIGMEFTTKEIIKLLAPDTPKSSIYSWLSGKVNNKEVKKLGPGKYKKVA